MMSQQLLLKRVVVWSVRLGLALLLCAIPTRAGEISGDYIFLIGSGFICDSDNSGTCPAVVKSAQGGGYEMSGAGTFATQSKLVTAAGTFTHKSASGNALETGVWIASELVSFDSYGITPGALMREGQAFGLTRFGPMRSRMFSGPMPAGGLAVFRIRLLPMRGVSRTATLEVNCVLGKVPEERQTEGIRLTFEGGSGFDQEFSGRTMFVLTRPGAGASPKAPGVDTESNPASADAPE
jgi:hypothetical protein